MPSSLAFAGHTRRRFLGVAGAALGAALLGGCGVDEAGRAPPSDADVLARLLRHERAAVAALAASPALRDQDRRHAARLARELAALGAAPGRAADSGDPGDAATRAQDTVFAHVEALPEIADPELRVLVMQIVASDAAHLAALRLEAGEEPVPDAFAGYTLEPSA